MNDMDANFITYAVQSFRLWKSMERRLMPGNNNLKPEKEARAIRLMYECKGCRQIERATKMGRVTAVRLKSDFFRFLTETPEFPEPHCGCGGKLWHRGTCQFRDGYLPEAQAKGHETQAKNARKHHADGFFQTQSQVALLALQKPCACGCGQIANFGKKWIQGHSSAHSARQREQSEPGYISFQMMEGRRSKVRSDMVEFLRKHPVATRDMVFSEFAHTGYSTHSLGRLLRSALGRTSSPPKCPPLPNLTKLSHTDIFFQTISQTQQMSDTLTIEPPATITRFAQLVQQGIDAWTEAGKLLVRMIEDDPTARDRIIEECPDLTPEILARFEAIGRNQLHPKTLLNNSPGMRRLRQLPFSEQQKFLAEPVPLLVRGDSGPEVLKVQVQNLTGRQAQQVFSAHAFRPLEAQRAYVESKRPLRASQPYTIKGHKVVFHSDCEMTVRELADLVAKLS